MKPMFAKEMRENAKWAILGLVGMSAALIFAVAQKNSNGIIGIDEFWPTVWLVMTIAGPLLGAALGLGQILPELRRDQWAFLIHRPATHGQLWAGKTAAGLTLYALATLLPLLGAGVWAATPGHLAGPFDIRLLLPGVASILTGIACYFAGQLTAIRPARWWGSRALALPAAIIGAAGAAICTEFWIAATVALAFALVIGLAARGSFLTMGEYDNQPRTGKFSLGMTLYVGIIVTLVAAAAFIYSTGETLFARQRQTYRFTHYQFSKTGQVLRVTWDYGKIVTATDLAGRPVVLPSNASQGGSGEFLSKQSLLWPEQQGDAPPYNRVECYILTPQSDGDALWYFVQSRRQIVGYANESRLPIGVLGPRGFAPMERSADAGQFPGAAQVGPYYNDYVANGSRFYQFSQSIYRVNVAARAVAPLLSVAPPDDVRAIAAPQYDYERTNAENVIIATRQTLQAFPKNGSKPFFVIPYAADLSQFPIVTVMQTPKADRFFFWYQLRYGDARPSLLTEYNARGRLIRRLELPPLPGMTETPVNTRAVGLFAPPVAAAALLAYDRAVNQGRDAALPTIFALSLLSGLLSAVLAFLIGRRCVFSKTGQWAWAVGVFWLGLPGVLLLLSLHAWPALAICPNCKKPRVVTRALCEHCAAPFTPPAPDGTEIFEEDAPSPGAVAPPSPLRGSG